MQQLAVLLACGGTEANVTAWDIATAAPLGQFKGCCSGRGRVCRVGRDYFAAAQAGGKDALHFWAWHKDQVLQRCFTQEPITALAASADGALIAAGGASGTLHLWEAASGRLLRSWPAHYKPVSALAFTDTGGVLVSGGEDALVAAWLLAEVADARRDSAAAAAAAAAARVEPLHAWSEHTLPVTAIHVGLGEAGAVVATASLDRSVRLLSLATGKVLRSVALPAGVTAVALDAGEHVLLAGGVDGSIWEVPLFGGGGQLQRQRAAGAGGAAAAAAAAAAGGGGGAVVVGGPGSCCYEGHTKAVSSLAVTPDGEWLVSGSEDGTARVWDLRSRQCLRTVSSPMKAPVAAALLVAPWPAQLAAAVGRQGGGGAGVGSGARQGPKRPQPLAPLAKFVGAAAAAGGGGGGSAPWEGPPVVLDGAAVAPSVAAGSGLLPEPLASPLDALQLFPTAAGGGAAAGAGAGISNGADAAGHGAAAAGAAAGDVMMDVDAVGGAGSGDAAALRAQVAQLQAQLREARAVAADWQALHGKLHHFCTERVLAPGGGAAAAAHGEAAVAAAAAAKEQRLQRAAAAREKEKQAETALQTKND